VLFLSVVSALVGGCYINDGIEPMRDSGPPPGSDAGRADGFATDRGLPPADTDGDGLSDDAERERGTNPRETDSDGDGFDDGVEVLAGTNPTDRFDGIPATDFYVILPFEEEAVIRELDFRARLGLADVLFLVDTTGSMGTPIDSVRTSLSTTIVPAIAESIADAVMAVGDYRDFPTAPYGEGSDWPILIRQTMTNDVPAIQAALDLLEAGGGYDGPESTSQALYVSVADPCPIPDGGWGAACFRNMTHPIIVVVTDVMFHNGPNPMHDYGEPTFGPPLPEARTWAETVTALVEHDVRTAGVAVSGWSTEARDDLRALAEYTSSYDSEGNLTVYESPTGEVEDVVVNGIVDLVGAVRQDVTSMRRDDASDAVDATQFINSIVPIRSSRPTTFDETSFYGVPGGATITFEVEFENDFRPAAGGVQIYRAYIDIYDIETAAVLDTRNVYIIIPPEGGIVF
jgi:hypothetical protein